MKKQFFLFSICLMIYSNAQLPELVTISAEELKAKIEECINYHDPEHCDFMVINVLGPRLYGDCHIKGSLNAPLQLPMDSDLDDLYELGCEWIEKGWQKNKTIIVYCVFTECDASEKGYYLLKGMGFEKVIAYEGGMREWFLLNYPCAGPCSYDYLQVNFHETKVCPCRIMN